MNPHDFDSEDRALQKALGAQESLPPPPSTVHQFASNILSRQEQVQPSLWRLHLPMAASSAAALAMFFSLQSEPTTSAAPAPVSIEWADLNIEESDTLLWRGDALDADNHSGDVDVEENLFADMDVSDEMRHQYDVSSSTSIDDLDDDALSRLDELLNLALKNKGG